MASMSGLAFLPLKAQPAPHSDAATGYSNYQNATVNSILDLYEGLSGKHLIRDSNLNGAGTVSINGTGLSKADMIKMIESSLLLNGVAIVPVDAKTSKVIAFTAGKNPRAEGVKLYANAADLPQDDEVVSYYMPLNYISPKEASTIFTANTPAHAYGVYDEAPSAQALIITESASSIRQLIALKELIDVPPARVVSEFIQLHQADSDKVATLLESLLDPKKTGGDAAGGVIVPPHLGEEAPLFNEKNLLSGSAQIVSDERANRLLIVTRPANLPFLEKLIAQLDEPDVFMVPQRRDLKYVLAQDILPALEAALARGKDEEDQIKNATSTGSLQSKSQAAQAPSAATSGSSNGTAVSAITPPLSAPEENDVPTVVTIGKTRLLADNRSNAIIVFGSPDIVARTFDMIDQLDRKPLQVYLATVIGELSVTKDTEFGIDLLQKYQKVGQGGLASSSVTPSTSAAGSMAVPSPGSLISSTGFPLPAGLTLYGAIGSTLDAYLRALETTNRFKIISRPSVYTSNNKLAVIASGSQVPVPSNITSGFTGSDTDLTTTASVQYQNVLLQLDIVPLINANREVTLKIRQTNNTLGDTVVISGNDVPTIETQEINTEVTVPDRSTVVIGGLISDTTKRSASGVPWLSDIPLIGYLFSDTDISTDREELIIMIQPTVVESPADQLYVNESEERRTILGREAEARARGETLDGSNKPRTSPPSTSSTTIQVQNSAYNSKTGSATRTESVTVKQNLVVPPNPNGVTPGVVPTNSTAAPDVSNGQLPQTASPTSRSPAP